MKYRKKPIEVEAEIYKIGMEDGFRCLAYGKHEESECKFDCGNGAGYRDECAEELRAVPYINTRQGKVKISPNDMIITQSDGERYPCNPKNFKLTYEVVV